MQAIMRAATTRSSFGHSDCLLFSHLPPHQVGGKYPIIQVPHVDDALQPVVNIIPLQLLSYHLTCLRGYNVDQPRNLAKSGQCWRRLLLLTGRAAASVASLKTFNPTPSFNAVTVTEE